MCELIARKSAIRAEKCAHKTFMTFPDMHHIRVTVEDQVEVLEPGQRARPSDAAGAGRVVHISVFRCITPAHTAIDVLIRNFAFQNRGPVSAQRMPSAAFAALAQGTIVRQPPGDGCEAAGSVGSLCSLVWQFAPARSKGSIC
jgi:hypothetical protein